jgi:hypothetical protein
MNSLTVAGKAMSPVTLEAFTANKCNASFLKYSVV